MGGRMMGGGMQPMMGAGMGPGWGPDPMMGGESPCSAVVLSLVQSMTLSRGPVTAYQLTRGLKVLVRTLSCLRGSKGIMPCSGEHDARQQCLEVTIQGSNQPSRVITARSAMHSSVVRTSPRCVCTRRSRNGRPRHDGWARHGWYAWPRHDGWAGYDAWARHDGTTNGCRRCAGRRSTPHTPLSQPCASANVSRPCVRNPETGA